ncbi:SET domain-containing protein-lysine N-methyltransferase [Aquicoccus sp. SCR17]|nr:SET domain-containing protein-lysine N-methyltransferase [Carideicomes alvinocaridis]
MMMVRSYLGPSDIEGLGVFCHDPIRKGQLVWLYDTRFDVSFFVEDIEHAPAHLREFMERYTYEHPADPERVVLDCDEGRFMNHSDTPAIDLSDPSRGIATRDIRPGEEITCDYGQFTRGAIEFQASRHRVGSLLHAAE